MDTTVITTVLPKYTKSYPHNIITPHQTEMCPNIYTVSKQISLNLLV